MLRSGQPECFGLCWLDWVWQPARPSRGRAGHRDRGDGGNRGDNGEGIGVLPPPPTPLGGPGGTSGVIPPPTANSRDAPAVPSAPAAAAVAALGHGRHLLRQQQQLRLTLREGGVDGFAPICQDCPLRGQSSANGGGWPILHVVRNLITFQRTNEGSNVIVEKNCKNTFNWKVMSLKKRLNPPAPKCGGGDGLTDPPPSPL